MSKRRYTYRNKPFGQGFLVFVIVAILAVGAGYGLTEYVVKPFFLGEDIKATEENPSQEEFNGSSIIIDQQDINDINSKDQETSAPVAGEPATLQQQQQNGGTSTANLLYCVQYGSFSDQAGAEAMVSTLTDADIAVMVIQKDGSYKVLGAPHMTKDEAKASLERTKAVAGDDLFVTTVEVRLQ